ncbi:MAG: hypothetical protein M1817_000700 [Caeruleum heppii]|nr:MAG: hypothetical protein M1817_000700 [Caeruleum heppii]
MDHMQFLMVRANESEGEFSGHALMASCPLESHIEATPKVPYTFELVDARRHEFRTLLDLSKKLDLDGEITPVMAWGIILAHDRADELTLDDFVALKDDLKSKSRCYGFGAVLEEFEVRDALSSVFARKIESYNVFT